MREAIGFGLLFSVAVVAPACTTLLGDDFRIGGGASTSSGVQGGGGSATSSSSSAGGGGSGGVGGEGVQGGGGGATSSSSSAGGGGSGGGCPTGYGDCNDTAGCETLLTTLDNCGACNARCIAGTCVDSSCTGVTQLALGMREGNFISLYDGHIYWTAEGSGGNGVVQRLPVAGGLPVIIANMQDAPYGIVVNARGVFWTNSDAQTVMRADLDGGAQQTILSTAYTPLFVAGNEEEIFWSQRQDEGLIGGPASTIGRMLVATNDADESFLSAPLSPHGIALEEDHLYWVDRATMGGTVNRVDRRTGTSPLVLAAAQPNPFAVAVDDTFVYWTNNGSGGGVRKVLKAGGAAPVQVATGSTLRDIAIDETNVYWTDQGAGAVMKVAKAGGTVRRLAQSDGPPNGIAVDATHVYWVTEATPAGLYKVRK
jgi:streptogramin lyase